jgi:uncharacterized OB-fold protein
MAQIPIQEGLFTWPSDDPRLIGSRCVSCGKVTFPAQKSCPACCREAVERVELPKRGTLWTWTIQGFPPKSPPYAKAETWETFVPYGVGYVELPNAVRIETRLTENRAENLSIGMNMELVIELFRQDKQGNDIMMFAFKPVKEA